MTPEITYNGTITDEGQLKIVNRHHFDDDIKAWAGKRVTIVVKKYKEKRSLNANAYYWGVVIQSVRQGLVDMGFDRHLLTAENVHWMMRDKFLKQDINVPDESRAGEFVTMVRSTADLSKSEFGDYIEDISRWAAEFLSIVIPAPEEQAAMF